MAIKKRYFVAGAIGLVTVAGAMGYLQFKKIMNYSLAFKGMKNVKLTILKLMMVLLMHQMP